MNSPLRTIFFYDTRVLKWAERQSLTPLSSIKVWPFEEVRNDNETNWFIEKNQHMEAVKRVIGCLNTQNYDFQRNCRVINLSIIHYRVDRKKNFSCSSFCSFYFAFFMFFEVFSSFSLPIDVFAIKLFTRSSFSPQYEHCPITAHNRHTNKIVLKPVEF